MKSLNAFKICVMRREKGTAESKDMYFSLITLIRMSSELPTINLTMIHLLKKSQRKIRKFLEK